ncbi:MAG: alpha/beta fold hydrolase [Trueperaceae bacterium]|nr:alpha/beta fold hydrolase [Trueperaceae bacterium]
MTRLAYLSRLCLGLAATLLVASLGVAVAQDAPSSLNRIDLVRPDAPELTPYGDYTIGVRTLELVDEGRLDIVNATEGEPTPTYDRPLTVEVWYPAALPEGTDPRGSYTVITRDGETEATITGRAIRDAEPLMADAPYPLVIISHGYPGNRYLMSHLGENLASKGYVTVSIDHTDSTYSDQAAFGSTLLNRPLDQLFVLDEMDRLSQADSGSFLAELLDADQTGIVGYSMGGYGVVNLLGGGFTEASVDFGYAPPNDALAVRSASNPDYQAQYQDGADPRIQAAIAIGPWGMNTGFWDAEGLSGVRTPIMFMAGGSDDVSGYENGIRAIFEGAVNAERYLLTFENANHNAAAPMPAPDVTYDNGTFDHYGDAVWDTARMNNIAQHFATAYFGLHLKDDAAMQAYLDLVEESEVGVWSVDDAGVPTDEHSYWNGFPNRTAVGLSMRYGAGQE